MEKIRLNKYLSNNGICSRRQADKYILEKKVKVNGEIADKLGTLIDQDIDVILVNNSKVNTISKKIYIMLNKPQGYVTTAKDQFNRPDVIDLIKENTRLYPVGRLDMYSEGLLLLTNDGEFTNNITHPKKHISKTYIVRLNKEILDKDLIRLENGVDIEGYITAKAITKRINKNEIEITIFEGKNRQIRRMCECLDYIVIYLKRIKIGNLELGDLQVGKYKLLDNKDIEKIFI